MAANYSIMDTIDDIIDGKKSVNSLSRAEAMAILEFYEKELDAINSGSAAALMAPPREGIVMMMRKLSYLAHCGHSDVERRYRRFVDKLSSDGTKRASSASGSHAKSSAAGIIIVIIVVVIVVAYFIYKQVVG